MRGVFWVTRTKSSHCFTVIKRHKITSPKILADEEVVLSRQAACEGKYPERMRRVRALVEVDGVEREMEFLTNNVEWSASSVANLYRCRWDMNGQRKRVLRPVPPPSNGLPRIRSGLSCGKSGTLPGIETAGVGYLEPLATQDDCRDSGTAPGAAIDDQFPVTVLLQERFPLGTSAR